MKFGFRSTSRIAAFAAALLLGAVCAAAPLAAVPDAEPFPPHLPWYNVSRPLTLADLHGRAVLLDFFSPGCINCVHMLPVEAQLEKHFGSRLVVIGVDTPKFDGSKSSGAVESFIARHALTHPIVLDTNAELWNAYGVHAWPSFILIGPDGKALRGFIGEQRYTDLVDAVSTALAAAPAAASLPPLPLAAAPPSATPLATPAGLAVSPTLVAIADTGHNRIVLTDRRGHVQALIGTGCRGYADGNPHHARFNQPHGLAFHDGSLYVADTGGDRIRRIDLNTRETHTVAGNGKREYVTSGYFSPLTATLNSPWGVAWDGDQLYVSMAGDHQIWRYDPLAHVVGPWAGTGEEGLGDGPRKIATFAQPSGLDAHAGVLYDADPESSSIRAIQLPDDHSSKDSSSPVTTLIGHGLFAFGMVDGEASHARLQHPEAVAYDNGSLYIADTFNNAIRRLDLRTHQVTTTAKLPRPLAIAVLDTQYALVASGDRLQKINLANGDSTNWSISGLKPPDACNGRPASPEKP